MLIDQDNQIDNIRRGKEKENLTGCEEIAGAVRSGPTGSRDEI